MQALVPFFKSRTGSTRLPPQGSWQVQSCAWEAAGGCKHALLHARAARVNLSELLDLLGTQVLICDPSGTPTWWGYADALTVRQGSTGARVSLQDMANRVRVVYSEPQPDGSAAQALSTAWADDPVSQGIYGIKDLQLRLTSASLAQALAYRDAQLLRRSRPGLLPLTGLRGGMEMELELAARGWFDTLAWRHYENEAGRAAYTTSGAGVQTLGDAAAQTRMAQSFTPGAGGWPVEVVWARLRKTGLPADNLILQLCADAGGAPGSVLASAAALPGTSIPEDYAWTVWNFSAPATLTASLPYWLVWARSGALSLTDHYLFKVNEGLGFSGGVLRLDNGSSWAARSPDADLLFWAQGSTQTSDQVAAAAAPGAGGQFLNGVRLDAPSGVFTCPYRDGSTTALREILAHLQAGTSVGNELLAAVTQERVLIVYPKPAASSSQARITSAGLLMHPSGAEVSAHQAAQLVGQWAALDAAWQGLGTGEAVVSERVWLQRLTWSAADGHVRVG